MNNTPLTTLRPSVACLSAMLILAPLTGCTAPPASSASAQASTETRASYRCDNGESIRVRFLHEAGLAILERLGHEIELQQQAATPGFLYSNGPNTLRGQGETLSLEIGRMMPIRCTLG